MTWGWKLAIDLDDVVQFLNGSGTHHRPIGDARICSLWKGNHTEYYIFYRCDRLPIAASAWGWKRATDPDDVCSFLSGSGRYRHPVKDAQIAALRDGNHTEFNVLYQSPALQERVCANWGWKLATDPSDVMNFLNGAADYRHPVTTARIAALEKDGHEQFYLFYQRAAEGDPIDNWSWKLATEADDALNFVNGQGAYHKGVKGFQAVALRQGSTPRFYLFANQGTRIWPQSPLENERTVLGEPVRLTALVTGDRPLDGDALAWVSSLDGALGYGSTLMTNALSPGTHEIWVEGYGADAFTPLRVFTSLDDLYEASPSPAEMARIDREFALHWIDGAASDERWDSYPAAFDQRSTDPSRLAIYAKLDVLRHQSFSEPLPFTEGKSIYERLKSFVNTLDLRLNCDINTGGGGGVSLSRSFSVWDGRLSGTAADPNACKRPFPNPQLYPYVNPLYLLVHEERHNEPDDPGHIIVNGSQMDPYLEGGSGHAWAAMYAMWVYKYGKYDPPEIKAEAKNIAQDLLTNRFPSRPTHSNPKVQAVIDELLGTTSN